MLRWRIFILALALILGLPLRLAGAASLPCQAPPTVAATAAAGDSHRAVMPRGATGARASAAALVDSCDHVGMASMGTGHVAGQCGMSAPCFIGAGPAAVRIDEPRLAMLHAIRHVSDPASRFLTSGIDRPPRSSLV